jgi:hypothetical protein
VVGGERASGRTGIFILLPDQSCNCSTVHFHIALKAAAVLIYFLAISFCISDIYLSPAIPFSEAYLTHLLSQLPLPFILLGDFNARNFLWGSEYSSDKGLFVADIFPVKPTSFSNKY